MTCNYLDDEPGNEGAVLSPEHPTSEEEDCADKVVHGDDDGSDEKGADEAHGGEVGGRVAEREGETVANRQVMADNVTGRKRAERRIRPI